MRAMATLCLVALAACTQADPAEVAERNWDRCITLNSDSERLASCSAVIADANAPTDRRVRALIDRGAIYALGAEHARAVADFGRALRLHPNNTQALLERGMVHHERSAFDSAIIDYDAALRIDPNLQLAAERRAAALIGRDDPSGRLIAFRHEVERLNNQIASAPDDPLLLNNRCWVRAVHGEELREALNDCTEALRLDGRNAAVFDSRGLVYLKLGDPQRALADYETALSLDPGSGHYLYGRGVALIGLGREPEGRRQLVDAERAQPGVTRLYQSYGIMD